MKKILNLADEYLHYSSWKDLALIKICVSAFGFLFGLAIPKKAKKTSSLVAMVLFLSALIPIMIKMFNVISRNRDSYTVD